MKDVDVIIILDKGCVRSQKISFPQIINIKNLRKVKKMFKKVLDRAGWLAGGILFLDKREENGQKFSTKEEKMKKRVLAAGLGIGLALAGAGLLTACGGGNETKDGLSIHTNFDTTYYVGQTLDVTGGILNYTKDGNTTQIAVTEDMISGFTTDKAGNRNMIVTYEGETLLINYTVNEVPTRSDVSTSKVYKSGTLTNPSTGESQYAYVRFNYLGEDLYFKAIGASTNDADSNYVYDSVVWDTVTGSTGLFGAGKVTANFDVNTESWTLSYSEEDSTYPAMKYTFNNVTEDSFQLKMDRDAFTVGSQNMDAVHLTVNMTKMSLKNAPANPVSTSKVYKSNQVNVPTSGTVPEACYFWARFVKEGNDLKLQTTYGSINIADDNQAYGNSSWNNLEPAKLTITWDQTSETYIFSTINSGEGSVSYRFYHVTEKGFKATLTGSNGETINLTFSLQEI